ncbi:hypothetical protein CASFOL_010958 [Castilleja foliolosa]|uniref:Uncharacterized protein n=1 Tax=Castilleja foliolosa TaxID=1961234 RepID=A0ABD3DU46_9LAMI
MKASREKRRPTQISHSLSVSEHPMKRRRCGENSSVAWYSLDKAKPMNEFHCTDFDDAYLRKAGSFDYFHSVKDLKHGQLEQAIESDSEFVVQEQEQDEQLQSPESDSSSDSDSDSDEESQLSEDDAIETELFDVKVMVKTSYRAENVPYVCLTSQLNGQAILGYPVATQALKSDDCETLRHKKESGARKLLFPPLVWKTAKRTPVCYLTSPISSTVSKNAAQAGENGKGRIVKEAKSRSCVPVELIFGKILAAVG